MRNTRITTDLGDPNLLLLLKKEAQLADKSVREIVIQALDAFFAHRLETRALEKISEETFAEWDNPLDAEYDKL